MAFACLCVAALGCGASEPPRAATPAAPPPTARSLSGPAEVATKWLNALADANYEALDALTHFPFQLHDTGSEGNCANGTARNAGELPATLMCLREDELLIAQLQANPTPPAEALGTNPVPAWASRWHEEVGPDVMPVAVSLPGSGHSLRFVVLVARDGVEALWKDASFELN